MDPERLCISCMTEKRDKDEVCPVCGFDPSSYAPLPHQLPPLTILNGRYLLGKALGEGGFGITYIAMDLVKEQRVAVKELYISGLLTRAEDMRVMIADTEKNARAYYDECKDKFLQEANILRQLEDKQGIVDIYDFFQENDTAYIVMEYLDGMDLSTYLKERGGRISFQEAFDMLRPIMHSLMSMHRIGIFHRDITPDNIRCLSNGTMKVMDLGSAKYNFSERRSQIVLVKPGYAPPEQYTSGFKVGPWMDVYAIAATFYRCVAGEKPKESILRADDNDITPPTVLGARLSRSQEKVLLKGLAIHPEDRYQDMREFYYALKQTVQHPGISRAIFGGKSSAKKAADPASQVPASSDSILLGNDLAPMSSDAAGGIGDEVNSGPVSSVPGADYQKLVDEINSEGKKKGKTGIIVAAAVGAAGALTLIIGIASGLIPLLRM